MTIKYKQIKKEGVKYILEVEKNIMQKIICYITIIIVFSIGLFVDAFINEPLKEYQGFIGSILGSTLAFCVAFISQFIV